MAPANAVCLQLSRIDHHDTACYQRRLPEAKQNGCSSISACEKIGIQLIVH
ncbi:hypothetical protein KIN20_027362 [Parelaphostrongylus tenuis]|uniref:Uncharacterized protein n=1 Tax=Parelaphostrongylus tenuis TaxID=148309 RepID=A0AAD5QZG4_PARTN|nr:hypothetical protein KIN20_027362 [Parelaphostrongylus tenuis]